MARGATAPVQRGKATPAKSPAGAKPKERRGGSTSWLLGMACGAVLAFATPTALLAVVLLAPAILTAVFDTEKKLPLTRVVFVSAAGFAFGPIWHLNAGTAAIAQALQMLADPWVMCPAWLAGGCGWGICEILPLILRGTADRRAASQITALRAEASTLSKEWDLEMRG